MSPKISIIVPVYNVAEYLPKCLDSLINQAFKNIEIICVNDGSTDNSSDILEEYAKKDKRIQIVNQKNGGLSDARNTGINKAKAPYIMFCDSDDYYDLDMCKKMIAKIEDKDSDLCACGTAVEYLSHTEMSESDQNYYRIKFTGYHIITDEIISKTDVSVCDKIFRTKLINQYNIRFPKGLNNEDFYFFNIYMAVAKSITFTSERLYHYVRRDNSIMSSNFEKNTLSNDHLTVAEKIFNFYKKNKTLDKHIDLVWKLWIDSYWFSYMHSSKKYHKQINNQAKAFIEKNFQKSKPQSPKIKQQVINIKNNNIFIKIYYKIHAASAKLYKTINISYRQQKTINEQLENILSKYDGLLDRIKEQ